MAYPLPVIYELVTLGDAESDYSCCFFHQNPHPSSNITVFFNFLCRTSSHRWLVSPNSSSPIFWHLEGITRPILETTLLITNDQLSHHLQAQLYINDHLLDWPFVFARHRRDLILMALLAAENELQSMPAEFNAVELHIPVEVIQHYVSWELMDEEEEEEDEDEEEEEEKEKDKDEDKDEDMDMDDEDEEEEEVYMHPTVEGAMSEFLKGAVVMETMDCAVWLEEMESGSEGKEMPCSHLFHEDCITQWVRRSHCCPMCRFEVATETEEDSEGDTHTLIPGQIDGR